MFPRNSGIPATRSHFTAVQRLLSLAYGTETLLGSSSSCVAKDKEQCQVHFFIRSSSDLKELDSSHKALESVELRIRPIREQDHSVHGLGSSMLREGRRNTSSHVTPHGISTSKTEKGHTLLLLRGWRVSQSILSS